MKRVRVKTSTRKSKSGKRAVVKAHVRTDKRNKKPVNKINGGRMTELEHKELAALEKEYDACLKYYEKYKDAGHDYDYEADLKNAEAELKEYRSDLAKEYGEGAKASSSSKVVKEKISSAESEYRRILESSTSAKDFNKKYGNKTK